MNKYNKSYNVNCALKSWSNQEQPLKYLNLQSSLLIFQSIKKVNGF